jgi:hypothetical protein
MTAKRCTTVSTAWGSRWYLAVFLVGLVAYPIVRAALHGLPDLRYPMMRIAGLLVLVSGLVSRVCVDSFQSYDDYSSPVDPDPVQPLPGISPAGGLRQELRSPLALSLLIEGLTLAFYVFLMIRLGNPDWWHPTSAVKTMEFSYFNAV